MNIAKTNRLFLWFHLLRRSSQVVLIITIFASVAVVAYAASILFNSAHSTTSLFKDWYIEVEISDREASGDIRPNGTVNIAPTVTNNGNITCYAFIKLVIPLVNSEPAYDFTADGSWTQIALSDDGNHKIIVYAYGTESTLNPISADGSTDLLCEDTDFTMRSGITGTEFDQMPDIDVDGYLVDSEVSGTAVDIWNELGQ